MAGMRSLTNEELELLLARLGVRAGGRDRVLVLLGAHTGFRVSELLALTIGHVADGSAVRREVVLERRRMKGGAGVYRKSVGSRRVVLTPTARAAIGDYLIRRFGGPAWDAELPLFPSRKGSGALGRTEAWRILSQAAQSCGLSGRIGTHSLRKTLAARVYENTGHDLVLTQKVLGHRHVTTTAQYLDTTQDAADAAVLAADGGGGPGATRELGRALSWRP